MPVKLVEVLRAGIVESIHRGDIVAVSTGGKILFELGDTEHMAFLRSAAKPLQMIAMLETGIADKFGLELSEIALMLSSHNGEKEHIDALKNMMEKIGIDEKDLKCGIHEPLSKEATKELFEAGTHPTKLHCNCSGKHIGQIAAAKIKGLSTEDYYKLEHKIQDDIQKTISEFCEVNVENIIKGVDGCGVPVYGTPLKNMALAYANLCDENFMEGKYLKSQNYVLTSMTMFPEMVGGKGRFDTELMKNFGDRLVGKFGDEGVYCAGLIGKGIGIAFKIEDGTSRAVSPVVIETLIQMKVISKDEAQKVKEFWNPSVLNHKGERVGEIKTIFEIN